MVVMVVAARVVVALGVSVYSATAITFHAPPDRKRETQRTERIAIRFSQQKLSAILCLLRETKASQVWGRVSESNDRRPLWKPNNPRKSGVC